MESANRWLLPDGIEELLPAEAAQVEHMRRRLLDLYNSWGYELLIPPLIEYTESLLIGLGEDLDLDTFKVTDQVSGRLLGIRPDITPQVARIDAHALDREGPVRLCYAGSVLHTRPRAALASRSPIQVGAELYGEASLEADIEVICLMLQTLASVGVEEVTLDLGHQAIVAALLDLAGFDTDARREYFEALQHKAGSRIAEIVNQQIESAELADWLRRLPDLHGGFDVLARARQELAGAPKTVADCIADLEQVGERLQQRFADVKLHFDLAELHGYHYHTGLVFAAYAPGSGQAVANGGRYDGIGEVFGRSRPATGFSTDLKTLLDLVEPTVPAADAIFAPYATDPEWWQQIQSLRADGEHVVCGLPGQQHDDRCQRKLVRRDDGWTIEGAKGE